MKKLIKYTLVGIAALGLYGCEDQLDRYPKDKLTPDKFFRNEQECQLYTNDFYTIFPTTVYGESADVIAKNVLTSEVLGNRTVPATASTWKWEKLRDINFFLEYSSNCKDRDVRLQYEGLARFFRAYFYFEKVKYYGDVPWVDRPLASNEEELYKGRDSRDLVMSKVIEDLDFAIEHLSPTKETYRVSEWTALALKSRVCLFEGTYRKYHSVDPSTGKAWEDKQASEKFLRECAEACEELMAAGVYSIVNNPANVKTQYRELFTQEAVNTTEVIWARQMSVGMTTFHDLTWRYTSGSYGQRWSLDQDFVKTYLNLDGSRHTATGEEFTTEVENRDYRLSQSIITPGYTKLVGGVSTATPPDFTVTLTGYQVIKFNIDDKAYESASVSYNSLPIMRYAEVLLNYAEAKAELGEFSDDIWNKTIKPLRERAGVDGKRPTSADPYLQQYYGLSDSDLLEIRRERAIELLLEGFRYNDLMRWHAGELLNKQWYGIYIPAMDTSYDLNGDGINDVCVISGEAGNEPGVTYIVLDDSKYSLENGTTGRLLYTVGRNFEEKRYLRPIPKTALNINPDLGQNYYWR